MHMQNCANDESSKTAFSINADDWRICGFFLLYVIKTQEKILVGTLPLVHCHLSMSTANISNVRAASCHKCVFFHFRLAFLCPENYDGTATAQENRST